ncbi:hypothetical protein ABTD84_20390, partial [Acinetobacter baumannii]
SFVASVGIQREARAESAQPIPAVVSRALADMPVIDGHNDLPWEIRDRYGSSLDAVDLKRNTAVMPRRAGAPDDEAPLMTDIPRL